MFVVVVVVCLFVCFGGVVAFCFVCLFCWGFFKLAYYPSTRRARIKQTQTAIILSASPVVWLNSWKINQHSPGYGYGT